MITQSYCMVYVTRLLIYHFVPTTIISITARLYKYTTPSSGCQYLTNAKRGHFINFNTNDKKVIT